MRKILITALLVAISSAAFASIDVYFSPDKNNEKVVDSLVESAKKTLDVAAYSLTLPSFANALIDAKERGVKVRVIMDKQQAGGPSSLDEALISAGIPLKIDSWSGLMHSKYIVIDGKRVQTGSFNFTRNAVFNNRENFIVTNDKKTVKAYAENFEQMWEELK